MVCTKKHQWQLDQVMRDVWLALHQDLSPYIGDSYADAAQALRVSDYAAYRLCSKSYSPYFGKPFQVKIRCQLNGFLDRYIFASDHMTDQEREDATLESIMSDEKRISAFRSFPELGFRVIQRARLIIKEILGEYDVEEHMQSCRFGRRAALKTPFQKSYLCEKLLRRPLTGAANHNSWFKDYVSTDPLLGEVLKERDDKTFQNCDYMIQSFVPKTWKKLRGILPNGQTGVFYTFGLGAMLTARLKEAGLNIKTLQRKHRRLARWASKTRKLTTADLRAASNSITIQHIMMLFPRKWAAALKFGRVSKIYYSNDRKAWYKTHTFAGMGNGFTFPLQTLVFYSLVKAISSLLGRPSFVSVYGDDLIYSSWLHKYVAQIFPMLGFNLNMDKTFCESDFRESCGGDYYRGYDVRPSKPEGQAEKLHPRAFLARLYQLRNSLLARWKPYEIPAAIYTLSRYMYCETFLLHVVPPTDPDYSGLKVHHPREVQDDWLQPVRKPRRRLVTDKLGTFFEWHYYRLTTVDKPHKVVSQKPYLWDELRALEQKEDETPCPYSDRRPKLRVMTAKKYYNLTGKSINWRHPMKLIATVACKGSSYYTDDSTAICNWPAQAG